MTALWIVIGASLGAPLRYLTDRAIQARHDSAFPLGTLTVNMAGSFLLGLIAAGASTQAVPDGWAALLGVGFCGALTTYSTFGYETLRLIEDGAGGHALLNVVANVTSGLGAAFFGAAVALALWG